MFAEIIIFMNILLSSCNKMNDRIYVFDYCCKTMKRFMVMLDAYNYTL